MRNTSQCQNSSSVDSYDNDASLTNNTPSLSLDEPPKKPKGQGHMKIFRTPFFFQTIPNQGLKNIFYFAKKNLYFLFQIN